LWGGHFRLIIAPETSRGSGSAQQVVCMSIRFACPSCQQPLEIDDQWAGQSVACPYCNSVVVAPASSTWQAGQQIPVASPARAGMEPPPPPRIPGTSIPAHGSSMAGWALAMSICSAGFAAVGIFAWLMAVAHAMTQRLGSNPTREQILQLQQEMLQSGTMPTHPVTTLAMIIGVACGILGLIFSIRTIMQGQRRGVGIFSCVLALFCIVCEGLVTVSLISISLLRETPG
jgi:hypothetical protein